MLKIPTTYQVTPNFQFQGMRPYFSQSYRPTLNDTSVTIFFKYNNDNNPFQIVRLTPLMPINGLSQVGGLITIFGLMKIGLWLYNQRSFERKILKENKKLLARELKKEIDMMTNVDDQMVGTLVQI